MKTRTLSFRAAHAWLRGYSDAKCGKAPLAPEKNPFPEFTEQYDLGYFVGAGGVNAPAVDTTGRTQCQA